MGRRRYETGYEVLINDPPKWFTDLPKEEQEKRMKEEKWVYDLHYFHLTSPNRDSQFADAMMRGDIEIIT